MVFVVRGSSGDRSRGLVSCEICRCPTSHDHDMRAQQVRDGAEQPVMSQRWDFFFFRDDGSGIRLQPEGSSRRIKLHNVDHPSDPVPPPQRGLGKSDGHGHSERYKSVGTEVFGWFDGANDLSERIWRCRSCE